MVLDNATTSESSFSEPQPSSDIDPYSTSSSTVADSHYPNRPGRSVQVSRTSYREGRQVAEPIYINLNDLPRPFAIRASRQQPKLLADAIGMQCQSAAAVLQRPMSQEEANALAFHLAKSLRIASYGPPIGFAVGVAMMWRTRKSMRFPFYAPFTEGSRWSKDRLGPLRGRHARYMWHGMRLTGYCVVSMILSQIFFASYAFTTATAGRGLDPRLQELTRALQQRAKDGRSRERGEGIGKVGNQESGPKSGETYEMARQRVQAQNMMRRSRQGDLAGHDASPTGGAFSDEYMNQGEQPGFMSEQEVRQQVDSGSTWSDEAWKSSQSDVAARRQAHDDASPQAPSKPAGGAWERLRSQAMSGRPDIPRRQSRGLAPPDSAGDRWLGTDREAASGTDSFNFSSSKEERQSAKSEAQRDFDRRLEQERAGKVFGEPDGKGKWN
ncbi:hypothetical protein Tdes44962_MAKER06671 [Teratosphaeria destructans]|uniref:Uncharacterized protein n=1 Tax=Teratosphaeria destructans TaxID=418781 RepID=A0A9W7T166_9PEZI|nr:hypothetical protein Tdes44962_MAKER06671 [Teratosphaeria destructans]